MKLNIERCGFMAKTKKPKKGIVFGAIAAVAAVSLIFGGSGGETAEGFNPETSSSVSQPSEAHSPSASLPIESPEETQDLGEESEQPGDDTSPSGISDETGESSSPVEEPSQNHNFVGSRESDKYHIPTCRWVSKIEDENLIYFKTEEEAESAGYSPCGTCKP